MKSKIWICPICNKSFNSRKLLRLHNLNKHTKQKSLYKNNDKWCCSFCNKEFENRYKAMGHLKSCEQHPNKNYHLDSIKRQVDTYKSRINNGIIVPHFIGKQHSLKTKQLLREKACNYLKTINPTPCRYNKKSINYFDMLSKQMGWNLQHAENSGEFYTGIGYFVDAYDKDLNIVVEYDEPAHYIDVYNNILKEKDIYRMNLIIKHLNCEFYRYNEKTEQLIKYS
jgi:hypothetical protein